MTGESIAENNHRNRVIQGLSLERFERSLKNRIMRKAGKIGFVRSLLSSGYMGQEGVCSEVFPDVNPAKVSECLSENGIWQGFKLPQSVLKDLKDFAMNTPTYGNRNPLWGFHVKDLEKAQAKVGVSFTVSNYFNTYEQCPAIRLLAQDPMLNEIALRYVGPKAKLLSTGMWWSYASNSKKTDQNQYAQLFHYDLDDYKFVKFFFYLTDVNKDSGPHVYVKQSHREKYWRHLLSTRRFQDSEIEEIYPMESIMTLEGRAGDGFAEDTFGIHKGAHPVLQNRLILEIYYAISKGFTDYRDTDSLKMIEF